MRETEADLEEQIAELGSLRKPDLIKYLFKTLKGHEDPKLPLKMGALSLLKVAEVRK